MKAKEPPKKLRGTSVYVPAWWLQEVNLRWKEMQDGTDRWSMQRLADALTDAAGRQLHGQRWKWDRKTVERFLDNKNTTLELVDAFCEFFEGIIPPFYVAESPREAAAFYSVAERYRADRANPEKARRRAELAKAREAIEQTARQRAKDQSGRVDSVDEGVPVGEGASLRRRARGVARSRSTSS
jgi:hypothetical protein